MMLSLTREAQIVMESVILVTGAMRTGSTMLGRLLRSMQRVEAFHEPGVVYSLFPLITKIDSDVWKFLFSTSVFEDALVRSLNGTAINMNQSDESWVGYSLDDSEQTSRMSCTLDREALVQKSLELSVCVKVPEMTSYLKDYRQIFPKSQIILTIRRPERVITSLMRKGYFTDERLLSRPKKWPNCIEDGKAYPFWLPEDQYSEWRSLSEFSRCCLCFSFQYDHYVANSKDLIVDYDALCAKPSDYWLEITSKFGWSPGALTDKLLASVKEPVAMVENAKGPQEAKYLAKAVASYQRIMDL